MNEFSTTMLKSWHSYYTELQNRKLLRKVILEEAGKKKKEIEAIAKTLNNINVAIELMSATFSATLHDVVSFMSDIVTQFLQHVFGEEYSFKLVSSNQYNKNALTPVIVHKGTELSPREEVGGGLLDVIATGMRLAHWVITSDGSSPVLVLDEPGKFLDKTRLTKYGEALNFVTKELGIQTILVTHEPELASIADAAYRVEQEDGTSIITKI